MKRLGRLIALSAMAVTTSCSALLDFDLSGGEAPAGVTPPATDDAGREPDPMPLPQPAPNAGKGDAIAQPPVQDFGRPACGTVPAPKVQVIRNAGSKPFSYTATLSNVEKGAVSAFSISPTTGVVPPGGQVEITVTPGQVSVTAGVAENLHGDTMLVATDIVGEERLAIPLLLTPTGAALSMAPSPLDFGGVKPQQPESRLLTVTNSGNVAATPTYSKTGAAFDVNGNSVFVPAKGSATVTVKCDPGSNGEQKTGSLIFVKDPTAALCKPLATVQLLCRSR